MPRCLLAICSSDSIAYRRSRMSRSIAGIVPRAIDSTDGSRVIVRVLIAVVLRFGFCYRLWFQFLLLVASLRNQLLKRLCRVVLDSRPFRFDPLQRVLRSE